jgi:hypothetical protein
MARLRREGADEGAVDVNFLAAVRRVLQQAGDIDQLFCYPALDPIRPKQAMISPDRTIHPKPLGATLLAFDEGLGGCVSFESGPGMWQLSAVTRRAEVGVSPPESE